MLRAAALIGAAWTVPSSSWEEDMHSPRIYRGKDADMLASRVVVLMTSIPPRLPSIEAVVDSMLKQSWSVARVILSLPAVFKRTGEAYELPEWLLKKNASSTVLEVHRCEDMGPGTHLLNGLKLETDPFTLLVVVDDDHVYDVNLVETLVRFSWANPGSAVGAHGWMSRPGLNLTAQKNQSHLQDHGWTDPIWKVPMGPVLVSYLGMLYFRGFFDDTVLEARHPGGPCYNQDDMWFSAHVAAKGIPRRILGAALRAHELTSHRSEEALTYVDAEGVYTACHKALFAMNPRIWEKRPRVVISVPASDLEVLAPLVNGTWKPDLVYLPDQATTKLYMSTWNRLPVAFFPDEDGKGLGGSARSLLSGPMTWEGEADTVVVLPVLPLDPAAISRASACASRRGVCNVEEMQALQMRALVPPKQPAQAD